MPFQQPLVPPGLHVADPLDLPLRDHGEGGLRQVTRAGVTARRENGWELEVAGSTDEALFAEVAAASTPCHPRGLSAYGSPPDTPRRTVAASSRRRPRSVLQLARAIRGRDIPCDVLHIDNPGDPPGPVDAPPGRPTWPICWGYVKAGTRLSKIPLFVRAGAR
ncbi:MAG: hypothetical protein HOY75_10845 [Streptomyces sp.]|nr:hypothetical protein [Streptomyces sp.]